MAGRGRPIGSKDTKSRYSAKRAAITHSIAHAQASGAMPLDVILAVMRNEPGAEQYSPKQIEMAIAAAPYLHARLASTDMTMKSDNTHRVVSDKPLTEDEWVSEHAANDAAKLEPETDKRDVA